MLLIVVHWLGSARMVKEKKILNVKNSEWCISQDCDRGSLDTLLEAAYVYSKDFCAMYKLSTVIEDLENGNVSSINVVTSIEKMTFSKISVFLGYYDFVTGDFHNDIEIIVDDFQNNFQSNFKVTKNKEKKSYISPCQEVCNDASMKIFGYGYHFLNYDNVKDLKSLIKKYPKINLIGFSLEGIRLDNGLPYQEERQQLYKTYPDFYKNNPITINSGFVEYKKIVSIDKFDLTYSIPELKQALKSYCETKDITLYDTNSSFVIKVLYLIKGHSASLVGKDDKVLTTLDILEPHFTSTDEGKYIFRLIKTTKDAKILLQILNAYKDAEILKVILHPKLDKEAIKKGELTRAIRDVKFLKAKFTRNEIRGIFNACDKDYF